MKNSAEKRTMEVVLAEVKENITNFNLSEDAVEKAKLEVALKSLENEYNELSLLNSYNSFMAAENPMVAFAKAYSYEIIGHKDVDHKDTVNGVKIITRTRVLDDKKAPRVLNVQEFVEWTEERGECAAYDKKWYKAIADAREAIIDQWKGFMNCKGDTRNVSIKKMKEALQGMVNALVFIQCPNSDKNAVMVKSALAKAVFAFCNQRKDGLQGTIMPASVWKKLQMDILHGAVAGKEFTITYGDEDPADESDATAEEKTEESK